MFYCVSLLVMCAVLGGAMLDAAPVGGTQGYAGMVAFSVASNAEFGPSAEESTVPFELVETNIGGGFQPETSHFIAPVAGIYYFQFALRGSAETPSISGFLGLNGQVKAGITTTDGSAGYSHTSTNAAILNLAVGDNVHVVLHSGYKTFSDGYRQITFSGFMIQQAI